MTGVTQDHSEIASKALKIAFSPEFSMEEKRRLLPIYINPDNYIQHGTTVSDGYGGLMQLIEQLHRSADNYGISIKRTIAQDDLVFLHCHYLFGNGDVRGKAIAEIFRIEDGRLVEHWDVIQDVPAKSANTNGMF
ncbi:hypothetical protein A9995_15420 [Erythrobacter sp. QSSC1-22B]|uniref:nuclear transport factor 2 family protein n=1 Tax=Erythrobacter sp. QSSC1-22B TaxID=1860125 RepID=UPI000804E169|nr:ester cyclase [Erythrobacter sp. QSSC1-22B]OBX17610.1 hypothetical protein A9995_15420 [Erythrobacter sp. QSSC1-22B]